MSKIKFFYLIFLCMLIPSTTTFAGIKTNDIALERKVDNHWSPMFTQYDGGLFGEHVDLWRKHRLWYVLNQDFLLQGFESRPGVHTFQGEHVGKWIHAATLTYQHTCDPKLKAALDNVVERLIATQLSSGYMGTYDSVSTFIVKPEEPTWDVWTHRYNLYGLLTYESFFPNKRVLDACCRMGDLLIDTYGEGKNDLTKSGTRSGMSSTTLLESIVMLYERTGQKRYLDFAKHIVAVSEANPGLHLMGEMLTPEADVVKPGDGKAYQLMSNMLGYFRLYQVTGEIQYLKAVQTAWDSIRKHHLLTTGGPWSRKMDYNVNIECFAYEDTAFDPRLIAVEDCSNVTWIQLCLQLFDLTGMRKFMDEAEKCTFNDLFGHQGMNGIENCYYTSPNRIPPYYKKHSYLKDINCCNSSLPRALELMADHIAGEIDNSMSINILTPAIVDVGTKFGGGKLVISGNYPLGNEINVAVNIDRQPHVRKNYSIEFRVPVNTELKSVEVNGAKIKYIINKRGYVSVKRSWKPGDLIHIVLDYHLRVDIQTGANGKKWVAFSYGPLALAQRITAKEYSEPFVGMALDTPEAKKILLDKFKKELSDGIPHFSIGDTGVVLIPYYCAGSKDFGIQTYFAL